MINIDYLNVISVSVWRKNSMCWIPNYAHWELLQFSNVAQQTIKKLETLNNSLSFFQIVETTVCYYLWFYWIICSRASHVAEVGIRSTDWSTNMAHSHGCWSMLSARSSLGAVNQHTYNGLPMWLDLLIARWPCSNRQNPKQSKRPRKNLKDFLSP